ncbi:archaeosine synthase subunit alpha [Halosimplex salinum]|uniref:archaeosine synthase subunit alpha n=1 Tax=Halosimplex salinum TaxID=1710538 RepID=UPI000F4A6D08|nr:archaeosine synthase subunit alpha [Halosimplex salinum]
MTDYFEVHERDGAARLAELRLDSPVTTPALVTDADRADDADGAGQGPDAAPEAGVAHPVLSDPGSGWATEPDAPEGDDSRLTILPARGFPAGTPDEVQDAFEPEYPDVDFPSAAVVSATTATDHGTDAYVLSGAHGLAGHARAFVDAMIGVREAIPPDTALYLPGVATPANVATLVYAGVDLVDADRAVVRGTQGRYLTVDGHQFLEDLDELPCACPACQQPREEFDREDCARHNVNALAAALKTVRRRIRDGRLRDYIEGQARHEQWLTATFRRLDQQYAYLEERTPILRQAEITAATEDTIRRVEIQRFAERVTSRYRNRFDNPLVLVPCSARKPYTDSQSHGQYHDAVQWRAHKVSMTSPIGVVPQELELTYPAQHYDSVVTGRWSANEIEFVANVLERYLERTDYPRVIAHVPEDYRPICERVEESLGTEFTYTVEDHPTTTDSLGNLASELSGELKYGKRERQHNTVRAIADYQFGDGAGDALFDDLTIRGSQPGLQAHDGDGNQLAVVVRPYGTLAFTLAGARRWVESDAPTKRVEIDDFVPHGSVLAPGIVDADESIRVGDEVVFEGPSAFAVGRAEMTGPEMARSSRGIAAHIRHVDERD